MSQSPRRAGQEWRQIIERQQSSGQSAAAWCRQHGISQASFFAWKRRLGTSGSSIRLSLSKAVEPPASPTSGFVEVKAAEEAGADGIEIFLRGGRCLRVRRGFDRDLLVELVRTLEEIA